MTETELEYQFCFNCDDRKQCYTKPKDCTRIQEEIGLQEMTNEEWFCSLSTEEKAKWLNSHSKFIYDCGQKQIIPKVLYEEDWEWWLKQQHREE